MKECTYVSPVGDLRICEEDGKIERIYVIRKEEFDKDLLDDDSSCLRCAKKQLEEYFRGERTSFDFEMNPKGTAFQKQVWKALVEVPYGETRTYKQIAEAVGSPKGFRAVGLANNKNPIMIAIPCHRIIGSNGNLVGYAGGLAMKEYLLMVEQELEY